MTAVADVVRNHAISRPILASCVFLVPLPAPDSTVVATPVALEMATTAPAAAYVPLDCKVKLVVPLLLYTITLVAYRYCHTCVVVPRDPVFVVTGYSCSVVDKFRDSVLTPADVRKDTESAANILDATPLEVAPARVIVAPECDPVAEEPPANVMAAPVVLVTALAYADCARIDSTLGATSLVGVDCVNVGVVAAAGNVKAYEYVFDHPLADWPSVPVFVVDG